MNSNIEIKAKARDLSRAHELAEQLSDSTGELLVQEDTFFHTPQARLKLRVFAPDHGELIYYERPDQQDAKESRYIVTPVDNPATLKETLACALGVKGVVRKKRTLYLVSQTRIHLDEVEGLGEFVELEVVMRPGQPASEGHQIIADLTKKLEISQEDLIHSAYIDLLLEKDNSNQPVTAC